MGIARRFLNLIVDKRGTKSLRCIDLNRQKFFDTPASAQRMSASGSESEEPQEDTFVAPESFAGSQKNRQAPSALKFGRIYLPDPSINFMPSGSVLGCSMHCFPLAGHKVLCAGQSGHTFLFDADRHYLATTPDLNMPKVSHFSIFVPSDDGGGGGGSLFIMERRPGQETNGKQQSHQFEAFVYRKPTSTSFTKSWNCQLLPPPPFICDPKYWHRHSRPKIRSYGVVDSGSSICISVEGAGTYYLDTVNHVWSSAGEWTLPFQGKFEYVPELQLWFGLSAKDGCLAAAAAAADLSAVDSWKELEPPEDWTEILDPQLIGMGSGRFCIARFFQTCIPAGSLVKY